MKLSELLTDGQVLVGFSARDKWEALTRLVDLLIEQGRLEPARRQPVYAALAAREKLASTGMEEGVALPHASVDGVEEARAVLALSTEGVPFDSADNLPARILVLLVIPRKAVKDHIRTLSGVARLLSSAGTREALLRARTPREALELVREKEA